MMNTTQKKTKYAKPLVKVKTTNGNYVTAHTLERCAEIADDYPGMGVIIPATAEKVKVREQ